MREKKRNWEVGGGYVLVDGRAGSEWEHYRSPRILMNCTAYDAEVKSCLGFEGTLLFSSHEYIRCIGLNSYYGMF